MAVSTLGTDTAQRVADLRDRLAMGRARGAAKLAALQDTAGGITLQDAVDIVTPGSLPFTLRVAKNQR